MYSSALTGIGAAGPRTRTGLSGYSRSLRVRTTCSGSRRSAFLLLG
jgi:hypothetical protein